MLAHLTIRNFAIIDEAALTLDAGTTALTGETGAGKSILLDALGLVLGDRADNHALREDAERAEVVAEFRLDGCGSAREWLAGQEMDAEEDCVLRRTVGRDGRSRGFINGRPVTLQQLRELGELLVDIHGQHAHQSLLKPDAQRQLLDEFAGHAELLAATARAHADWQQARQGLEELAAAGATDTTQLEALRHQLSELERLDLQPGEWQRLDLEHQRLAHAGDLLQSCHGALEALYEGEQAICGGLAAVAQRLRSAAQRDPALAGLVETLESALLQVEDASTGLRDYTRRLDLDPGRLEWLDQRIGAIHQLARKHRVEPEALPQRLEALRERLEALDSLEARLSRQQQIVERCEAEYREHAARLGASRARAAARLGEGVTQVMQELGMAGGRLQAEVEPGAVAEPRRHGLDRVALLVSANPGQALQPLQKVASGGELSRISLAIQVIGAVRSGIPTLIFDEVDSGIGGGVAEAVGEKLRRLGGYHQVLCVTHLPQVAALAHQQLRVRKLQSGDHAASSLEPLAPAERIEELARMLGGRDITEKTRAHAREMLARASRADRADALAEAQ